MERFLWTLNILICIACFGTIETFGGQRSEIPQFPIERYTKAIISNDTLYINQGQQIPSPHYGTLLTVPLTGAHIPERYPSYSGVYVEDWLAHEKSMISAENQFQFCWDIVAGEVIMLNIIETWMGNIPQFTVMSIPLEWLTASTTLQENYPLETYGVSGVFPLDNLFGGGRTLEQRTRVFFDVIAVGPMDFRLYISNQGTMSVWKFDQDVNNQLKALHPKEIAPQELLNMLSDEWKEVTRFSLEFEGPFRATHIGGQTYILSETEDTLYQIQDSQLIPILSLPHPPKASNAPEPEMVFIVDNDREQFIFFTPSFTGHSPTIITVGSPSSEREGLEQALRSVLESPGRKERR
ncbi:hypothetical protein JW979_08655 [bacterium]|nr:hypothetical protein [candidate division CSSED10-310 bacterium]